MQMALLIEEISFLRTVVWDVRLGARPLPVLGDWACQMRARILVLCGQPCPCEVALPDLVSKATKNPDRHKTQMSFSRETV